MQTLRHLGPLSATLLLAFSLATGSAAAQGAGVDSTAHPAQPEARGGGAKGAASALLLWGAGTGALLLDEPLRAHGAAPNAEGHPAAHAGNVLGRGRLMVLGIGGVYGAARVVGNEPLAAGAGRVFAGLAAAGVVNGALKFGVGRLRPHAGEGSLRFRPFNLQNRWQSFPAGHALAAFALAAALSEEAGSPWVTVPAFGAATLVGWSRIYDDKHWTSDVVGGAAIGTLVSRGTVRWLRQRRGTDAPLPIAVVAMPDGIVFYLPLP